MTENTIREMITADNAGLPNGYEVISNIATDNAAETAEFATAQTIEGNLGTYTVYSVRTLVLTGRDTGFVGYLPGYENTTRDLALAVIASRAV